jgi:hypothetical protein
MLADYFNFSFRRLLTCCGFALPCEAFIIWPTKKPMSLPFLSSGLLLYWSTCLGLALMTSSTSFSMALESVTCCRPLASIISSTVPSPVHIDSKTVLAINTFYQYTQHQCCHRGVNYLKSVFIHCRRELTHDPVGSEFCIS